MRDPNKTIAKRTQYKRRSLLAVMIVASSPLLADGPQSTSKMPPLPLKASMQANPFCPPVAKKAANGVQLASGFSESTIRLKPIGAAIGLHSIGTAGSEAPRSVRPSAMRIESIPSRVHSNPLIRSEHHQNQSLVNTNVDDQANLAKAKGPSTNQSVRPIGRRPIAERKESTLVLSSPTLVAPAMPAPHAQSQPATEVPAQGQEAPKHVAIAKPTASQQPTNPRTTIYVPASKPSNPVVTVPTVPAVSPQSPTTESNTSPASVTNAVPAVVNATPVAASTPATVPAPATVAAPAEKRSEPVYFSMSDRFDSPAPDVATPESVALEPPAQSPRSEEVVSAPASTAVAEAPAEKKSLADTENRFEVSEPTATLDAIAENAAEMESTQDDFEEDRLQDSADSLALFDDDDTLKPIASPLIQAPQEPIAVYQHAVSGPVDFPDNSLQTKRYRPPVDVTPVPIVFERLDEDASSSLAGATVRSVDSIDFDNMKSATSKLGKLKVTRLVMSRTQVRSLTLGGSVTQVKVADENVCQAFSAGPSQLKLVGTGNGVTRLVVWADTDDTKNPTRVRAFEVHVKDVAEVAGDSVGAKVRMLNQSIKKAFPSCRVQVRQQGGKLTVAGRCDSEASAKKVMQMVRKTCLVPAQDELVVR